MRFFHCDGDDSGCPQGIAKRGNYGSFLQDDWDTIYKMSESRSSSLYSSLTENRNVDCYPPNPRMCVHSQHPAQKPLDPRHSQVPDIQGRQQDDRVCQDDGERRGEHIDLSWKNEGDEGADDGEPGFDTRHYGLTWTGAESRLVPSAGSSRLAADQSGQAGGQGAGLCEWEHSVQRGCRSVYRVDRGGWRDDRRGEFFS
jgi:hypothetical protein